MDIYKRRRTDLMQFIPGAVAIIPTAPHQSRNSDVNFPFRPDSDFYYLTHFPEPEAVAVIIPGRPEGEYILFCRPKDPHHELWDGRRIGLQDAIAHYGADQAFPYDEFFTLLPELLQNHDQVYTFMGRYPEFDAEVLHTMNELRQTRRSDTLAPHEFLDLSHVLHEMRLIKKKEEVAIMRKAAKISAQAHMRAMRVCKPGMFEYQIEAELSYEFRINGSEFPAYPSIVAGGENACILHYIDNNCELKDGDLLLIDAGAEVDCYASDITRTFPVNGKFSGPQRDLYELVLAAQKAAIDDIVPHVPMMKYHETAVSILSQGLIDLGLLHESLDTVLEKQLYNRFYMHKTGHWLGMDVHDVGDYKIEGQWRELEAGMVLTVEPGLYIRPADDVDEKWHNIGIRIEDDVLVNRQGNEVLSRQAIKEVDDIEHLMRS